MTLSAGADERNVQNCHFAISHALWETDSVYINNPSK